MKQAVGMALSAAGTAASTQTTTLMQPQTPVAAARPQPVYQQPVYTETPYREDAGAGLNSAFRSLLALLLIGALGVAAWGAWQMMDGEGMNLPSIFSSQEDTQPTPTPTAPEVPTEQLPIEPVQSDNVEQPAVEQPTQAPPTPAPTDAPVVLPTQVVEPTAAPVETEPAAPIELIEPNAPEPTPTETTIEPPG